MKLYNFHRLIKKYSVPFHFTTKADGHWESGKWVSGAPAEHEAAGAIIPLPERKIYASGGTYTTKDRQLYVTHPLPQEFEGAQVVYKGDVYNVEEGTNHEDYADVVVYVLKWVSKFDRD